jgi:hypothetical protein
MDSRLRGNDSMRNKWVQASGLPAGGSLPFTTASHSPRHTICIPRAAMLGARNRLG